MSQSNQNAAYLLDVDGYTVWERLRMIRNFLDDRRQSLEHSELSIRETQKKISEATSDLEKERLELSIKNLPDLIDDCVREIAFLEKFEAKLMEKAELERISGKDDKEMYQINYLREHTERLVQKSVAETICMGRVSVETMLSLFRNRDALHKLIGMGIVDPTALNFLEKHVSPILQIEKSSEGEFDYKIESPVNLLSEK
jgi:hypothetical protein